MNIRDVWDFCIGSLASYMNQFVLCGRSTFDVFDGCGRAFSFS